MAIKTRKFRGRGKNKFSIFTGTRRPRRTSSKERSAAVKLQRQFRKKKVAKIVKSQKQRKSKCLIDYNKCMGYSSNSSS